MIKNILVLMLASCVVSADDLRFSGDQAHGLMAQVKASKNMKSSGNLLSIENITCEEAVISVDLQQPGKPLQKDYPMISTGCSEDANATDVAFDAFKQSSAHQIWLETGFISNPKVVESTKFKAKKLSCVYQSDRCSITK